MPGASSRLRLARRLAVLVAFLSLIGVAPSAEGALPYPLEPYPLETSEVANAAAGWALSTAAALIAWGAASGRWP